VAISRISEIPLQFGPPSFGPSEFKRVNADSADTVTRIPDAAPSHALNGVHTTIVVIRESGLTIIELELKLVSAVCFMNHEPCNTVKINQICPLLALLCHIAIATIPYKARL